VASISPHSWRDEDLSDHSALEADIVKSSERRVPP
jgi:hypothetical protein